MSLQKTYDTFDCLTLDISKILANNPNIKNFKFEKTKCCKHFEIVNWEKQYNVKLPRDMKHFYQQTDGLQITWSFQYDASEIRPVGSIRIPRIIDIKPLQIENDDIMSLSAQNFLVGLLSQASIHTAREERTDIQQPLINANSKIFELIKVCDEVKVCLIYENEVTEPHIYLLELETIKWQFLAKTFTEYLRMCIVHLGIPLWQLTFTSFGIPPWVEQLFLILAPHLLKCDKKRRKSSISPLIEKHYHKLDNKVFKIKFIKKKSQRNDGKNRQSNSKKD